jgi:hypothetical protein
MKGRGSGKTPESVRVLIKDLVDKSSISAVSKATGLGLATVHGYLNGVCEPTSQTLLKLSDYTDKTFNIEIKPGSVTYR